MTDADGDSQMRSSSSEDEVDNMYPDADDPATPPHDSNSSRFINPILSPPHTQDPPQRLETREEDPMEISQGQNIFVDQAVQDQIPTRSSGGQPSIEEQAPGAMWSNRKAREDTQRALEQVVDKGFNLREYRYLQSKQ